MADLHEASGDTEGDSKRNPLDETERNANYLDIAEGSGETYSAIEASGEEAGPIGNPSVEPQPQFSSSEETTEPEPVANLELVMESSTKGHTNGNGNCETVMQTPFL